MGMFDCIRCRVPLPDGYSSSDLMQTKDFDCGLFVHEISEDGRLLLDDGYSKQDANYHGIVNFYDLDKDDLFHEYNAVFTHGQLEKIIQVQPKESA